MTRSYTLILALLCLLFMGVTGCCETIGQAKWLIDGASVVVEGCVTSIAPSECYIEAADRSVGIWVNAGTASINIGDCVTVMGTMSTVNGERIITRSNLYPLGTQAYIGPLGMPTKSVGGTWLGYQDCVYDARFKNANWVWNYAPGPNNTGLLVKTWGTVTATYYSPINGARWFFVDDGYGATADNDDKGILVMSDADVSKSDVVTVTGNSSVECDNNDATRLIRSIRPRSIEDVSIVGKIKSVYPFSDEFNSDKLDPRWAVVTSVDAKNTYTYSTGEISLTAEPGWLTMSIPQINSSNYAMNSYHLVQPVCGNWDAEIKLRLNPYREKSVSQGVVVYLTNDATQYSTRQEVYPMVSLYTTSTDPIGTICCYPGKELCQPLDGDTAWFRLRKCDSSLYISWSQDGTNFSREYTITNATRKYLVFSTYSSPYLLNNQYICYPVTGYCDYIRFTPVD